MNTENIEVEDAAWVEHQVQPGDLLAYWEVEQGLVEVEEVEDFDYDAVKRHVSTCALCTQELQEWADTTAFFEETQERQVLSPQEIKALDERVLSQLDQWLNSKPSAATKIPDTKEATPNLVALAIRFAGEAGKRAQNIEEGLFQILSLQGTSFLPPLAALGGVRQSDEMPSTLPELHTEPMAFGAYRLSLDILSLRDGFELQLTLQDQDGMGVEGIAVNLVSDAEQETQVTDEDGIVEWEGMQTGVHVFTLILDTEYRFQLDIRGT